MPTRARPSLPGVRRTGLRVRGTLALVLAALTVGYAAGRYGLLGDGRGPAGLPPATEAGRWPVLRTVDGDTLLVAYQPAEPAAEYVRLLGINTPEEGRPGYREATAALASLVDGRPVALVFEGRGAVHRDRYGRLLAHVYAGDTHVNLEMVRLGWSRYEPGEGRSPLADAFLAAEEEARAARRGLWAR